MRFLTIVTMSFLTLFFMPPVVSHSALFGGLKGDIQKELDANPFLKKQGIVLSVLEEENGYVTIEMREGNRIVREKIHDGFVVGSSLWKSSKKQEKDCVNALTKTLEVIKNIDNVKAISLEASVNTSKDKEQDKTIRSYLYGYSKTYHLRQMRLWRNNFEQLDFKVDKIERLENNYRTYFTSRWVAKKESPSIRIDRKNKFNHLHNYKGFRWESHKSILTYASSSNSQLGIILKSANVPKGEVFIISYYVDTNNIYFHEKIASGKITPSQGMFGINLGDDFNKIYGNFGNPKKDHKGIFNRKNGEKVNYREVNYWDYFSIEMFFDDSDKLSQICYSPYFSWDQESIYARIKYNPKQPLPKDGSLIYHDSYILGEDTNSVVYNFKGYGVLDRYNSVRTVCVPGFGISNQSFKASQ